uniref:Intermediate transcription factor 3 small subunit n=1 Tax=Rousettus bat poxvirus TaxID=3141933 RepID=A0AAU7E2I6_9POXV
MFKLVPDLDVDAALELGDFSVRDTKVAPREAVNYVSRNRRLFVSRSRDDERKLAMGFFLPRLSFLNYKEINYMFRCVDTVRDVVITKKNNVIVAPYVALITLAARGYKLTETLLELFLPELYMESSKKFRFSTQIQIIQEKLGYASSDYYVYEFEQYYSTVCLILMSYRDDRSTAEMFDTRPLSPIAKSLSEVTYRMYVLHLRSASVQWSISARTLISQTVNTVLLTIYMLLTRAIAERATLTCALARENPLPLAQLVAYHDALARLVENMQRMKSFCTSKHDQRVLLGLCQLHPSEDAR